MRPSDDERQVRTPEMFLRRFYVLQRLGTLASNHSINTRKRAGDWCRRDPQVAKKPAESERRLNPAQILARRSPRDINKEYLRVRGSPRCALFEINDTARISAVKRRGIALWYYEKVER